MQSNSSRKSADLPEISRLALQHAIHIKDAILSIRQQQGNQKLTTNFLDANDNTSTYTAIILSLIRLWTGNNCKFSIICSDEKAPQIVTAASAFHHHLTHTIIKVSKHQPPAHASSLEALRRAIIAAARSDLNTDPLSRAAPQVPNLCYDPFAKSKTQQQSRTHSKNTRSKRL